MVLEERMAIRKDAKHFQVGRRLIGKEEKSFGSGGRHMPRALGPPWESKEKLADFGAHFWSVKSGSGEVQEKNGLKSR